jgi:hypothetical protein
MKNNKNDWMSPRDFILFADEKGWSDTERKIRWKLQNISPDFSKKSTDNKELLILKLIELVDSVNILVKKKIKSEN